MRDQDRKLSEFGRERLNKFVQEESYETPTSDIIRNYAALLCDLVSFAAFLAVFLGMALPLLQVIELQPKRLTMHAVIFIGFSIAGRYIEP